MPALTHRDEHRGRTLGQVLPDALMDAAGSQIMPKGGTSTGLGGMASGPAADPAPWLLTMAAGTLLAAAGFAGLRRSRHAAAAGHKL